jgi:hypothetical protein
LVKDKLGRSMDFIVTERGLVSPFRVLNVLETMPGLAQYKLVQQQDGSIDLSVVRSAQQTISGQALAEELKHACALLFGNLHVRIKFVDDIDYPKGRKKRPVESRVEIKPGPALIS